jgi:hypothetical protein
MVDEKNFTKLTQTILRFGQPEKVIVKVYPYKKEFLIKNLRNQIKDVPGGFWNDLYKKLEAKLEDRFGGVIHYKIEPVNGDYSDEIKVGKIS